MGGGNPSVEFDDLQMEFFKPLQDERNTIRKSIQKLAHFTSADAFCNIIRSGQIWMSNVGSMNDYQELSEGARIVRDEYLAYSSRGFTPGDDFASGLLKAFDEQIDRISPDVYAFSLSWYRESDRPSDRLLMWNRYGANGDGLCMVFNSAPLMLNQPTGDPLFWMPMLYRSEAAFRARIREVLQHIERIYADNIDWVILGDGESWHYEDEPFIEIAAWMLVHLALSHKHEAYEGEREIRLLYVAHLVPTLPNGLVLSGVSIAGRMRPVLQVELAKYPVGRSLPIALPKILEAVMVGPSENSTQQRRATELVLAHHGLSTVPVHETKIPYRRV